MNGKTSDTTPKKRLTVTTWLIAFAVLQLILTGWLTYRIDGQTRLIRDQISSGVTVKSQPPTRNR